MGSRQGTCIVCVYFLFFKEEDGIRDLVRFRGLGDVFKSQGGRRGWGGWRRIEAGGGGVGAVSYTTLTLPTILRGSICVDFDSLKQ